METDLGAPGALAKALQDFLEPYRANVPDGHFDRTPQRMVNALEEMLSGTRADPREVLSSFENTDYDQMIVVANIDFISLCSHHVLPFFGKVHFGYIPDRRIVGVSKVARAVDILSKRLQVQEHLTKQLVDTFQEVIEPLGCGAVIEASHMCMAARGAKKPGAVMKTNALTGIFLKPEVRGEFLSAIQGGPK